MDPAREMNMFQFRRGRLMAGIAVVAIVALALLASPACADPQSQISAYRKSYGLSGVTVDSRLTGVARKQAKAMAQRGSLDHNVYASFQSRMTGYRTSSAAENIARGTRTFKATFADWKASSDDNANLLMRPATRFGLASASVHGRKYWALILAAPAESKPHESEMLLLGIGQ
jgi:Cysteine-rich secretory protein family